MSLQASPRILKEARAQSSIQANRMESAYKRRELKTWADIERRFNIKPGESWTKTEFTWANFGQFLFYWRNSFEARLQAAVEQTPKITRIKQADSGLTYGEVTLYPEQQGVLDALNKFYDIEFGRAALCDAIMGLGKTYVAAARIKTLIDRGLLNDPKHSWRPYPIIVLTPKGVVEHWKRVLEDFGLGNLVARRKIYVFSDAEFTTNLGNILCPLTEDYLTGEQSYKWNPAFVPYFLVVDECHRYVRWGSKRTRKLLSLVELMQTQFLFMSATPMEKINDAYLFSIACNTDFMGVHVTRDSFRYFAGLLDQRPDKPNEAAMKRLRSILSGNIFSFPYVKPKFKAINRVQLVDFENERGKLIYDTAHQRYKEACRKSGKNTLWGQFEKLIALNNFRKTAEPLRAWYLAEQAAELFHAGQFAIGIGTAFKETITEVAFRLVDRYNVPRNRIAIVWGGKRKFRSDQLLSKEELDSCLKNPDIDAMLKDKSYMKRIRLTLKYMQDQHEHQESPEEQAYRHNKLKELKLLGKQSDNSRQSEVDSFQDGSAVILLFTIASGGIGLSFDKHKEFLLPRKAYFTPLYNGKEFQQGLGRFVRRASLSDAEQIICMLKDTVEEFHVVPILDAKLRSTAAITARSMDFIDLLEKDVPLAKPSISVRSFDEAAKDAEEDDTIVTDFHRDPDEDDEDEEIESADDLLKDL